MDLARTRVPLFRTAARRAGRTRSLAVGSDDALAASFVGRAAELAVLQAVAGRSDVARLVYVYGPPGVGKSSLLRCFARLARERGDRVTAIDMCDLDPVPEALIGALISEQAHGRRGWTGGVRPKGASVAAGLALLRRMPRPHVLVIDTYQPTELLDSWLRDVLLPQLPAATVIVLASQHSPASGWLGAPGWPTVLRPMPLSGLDREETGAFLGARRAPAELHAEAFALTRGHPLALALVAELLARNPRSPLAFAAVPDVVRALVQRFVGDTTDAHERAALDVSSVLRAVDEPMLAALVPGVEVGALFRWLESRSFIERGPSGLRLHAIARDVMLADLRWRAPERHATLVLRAMEQYVQRFLRGTVDPDRVALDVLFVHRQGLALATDWDGAGELRIDVARHADVESLHAMVARHEGADNAALFLRWLQHGLEVRVVRGRTGEVVAFVAFIALERARPGDIQADPATRAAWRLVKKTLRPGEQANLVRWWMDRDGYQAMSPATLVLGSLMMRKNFTPGLALSLWPVTNLAFWTEANQAMQLIRMAQADFESGGRRHAVFGVDLRERPMALWLADFTRRQAGADVMPSAEREVLTRAKFDRALRAALRQLHQLERLAQNPLARGRMVSDVVAADASSEVRAVALRRLIEEACEALAKGPRTTPLYEAIRHAYLTPAVKQEVAADLVGVSLRTYRRCLASAIGAIGTRLWQRELGADTSL